MDQRVLNVDATAWTHNENRGVPNELVWGGDDRGAKDAHVFPPVEDRRRRGEIERHEVRIRPRAGVGGINEVEVLVAGRLARVLNDVDA